MIGTSNSFVCNPVNIVTVVGFDRDPDFRCQQTLHVETVKNLCVRPVLSAIADLEYEQRSNCSKGRLQGKG